MVCFSNVVSNVVRGFSLVLHDPEGSHYKKLEAPVKSGQVRKFTVVEDKNSEKGKHFRGITGQTY